MSAPLHKLDENFFVAPQITPDDVAPIKAAGVRTIINNRPDGEAPDQPTGESVRAAAEALGLAYAEVPVVSGGIFPDHIAAMADAVANNVGPYLAYCRSGTRSCYLWAFLAARQRPADEVIETAAEAGYDVAGAAPLLHRISAAKPFDDDPMERRA